MDEPAPLRAEPVTLLTDERADSTSATPQSRSPALLAAAVSAATCCREEKAQRLVKQVETMVAKPPFCYSRHLRPRPRGRARAPARHVPARDQIRPPPVVPGDMRT